MNDHTGNTLLERLKHKSPWDLSKQLSKENVAKFEEINSKDFKNHDGVVVSLGHRWQEICDEAREWLIKDEFLMKQLDDFITSLYQQNNFYAVTAILMGRSLSDGPFKHDLLYIIDSGNNYENYRKHVESKRQRLGETWWYIPWIHPYGNELQSSHLVSRRGPTIAKFLSSFSGYSEIAFDYTLLVLGDNVVGKTSTIYKAIYGVSGKAKLLGGNEPYHKVVEMAGQYCRLALVDTANTNGIRKEKYMENSDGFIIVYNTTSRRSFETAQIMSDQVHEYRDCNQERKPPVLLIANSMHVNGLKAIVSESEGKKLAKNKGWQFLQCSIQLVDQQELLDNVSRLVCGISGSDARMSAKLDPGNKVLRIVRSMSSIRFDGLKQVHHVMN